MRIPKTDRASAKRFDGLTRDVLTCRSRTFSLSLFTTMHSSPASLLHTNSSISAFRRMSRCSHFHVCTVSGCKKLNVKQHANGGTAWKCSKYVRWRRSPGTTCLFYAREGRIGEAGRFWRYAIFRHAWHPSRRCPSDGWLVWRCGSSTQVQNETNA